MRFRTAALSLTAMLLPLASCSRLTDSTKTPAPVNPALVQTIISHCTDLAAPELGDGQLCIDNGFRVAADDFSFANWGRSQEADANVTPQTMIDLFGHGAVCLAGPDTQCVLRPAIAQTLEQWNNALAGGRCEGLATLSTRFFLRLDHPTTFQKTAARVADLKRNDPMISSSIVYWWATQFLTEVADRAATSREQSPLQLVDDLIQGLANGVGYTVGLYFGASGHSVTPFAVTHRGNNFVVHVYDNNAPGVRRELIVDSSTNTWQYETATLRADGRTSTWSGGTGTLELTPMSSRQGPFECPFCSSSTKNSPTIVTLASRDRRTPGYLLITTRDGRRIEASPAALINELEGATYTLSKGATGGLITISIPSDVVEFDVAVRRSSSAVPAGDVVVNIQRPEMPAIQVSGNLAHAVVGTDDSSPALLAVRSDDTSIRAPTNNNVRVSIAAGSALTRTELESGHTLLIDRIAANSIEVAIKGRTGSIIGTTALDATEKETISEITLALSNNGRIVSTIAEVGAIPVVSQAERNFTPRRQQTVPTTVVPSSIVISLPD